MKPNSIAAFKQIAFCRRFKNVLVTDRSRLAVLVDGITEDAVTGGAIGLPRV